MFHDHQGAPVELLQSKHRVQRLASLSDYDRDIWKTLYNWIKADELNNSLILITNAEIPEGSALRHLRPGSGRDAARALAGLEKVTRVSVNETNQRYYDAFKELGSERRRALVANIVLLDSLPRIGLYAMKCGAV